VGRFEKLTIRPETKGKEKKRKEKKKREKTQGFMRDRSSKERILCPRVCEEVRGGGGGKKIRRGRKRIQFGEPVQELGNVMSPSSLENGGRRGKEKKPLKIPPREKKKKKKPGSAPVAFQAKEQEKGKGEKGKRRPHRMRVTGCFRPLNHTDGGRKKKGKKKKKKDESRTELRRSEKGRYVLHRTRSVITRGGEKGIGKKEKKGAVTPIRDKNLFSFWSRRQVEGGKRGGRRGGRGHPLLPLGGKARPNFHPVRKPKEKKEKEKKGKDTGVVSC